MSDILQKKFEKTVYSGQIIEVIQQTRVDSTGKEKVLERAVRPPGVRLIIHDLKQDKILLTREYRYDLESEDWRLPGGKVCDTIADFNQLTDVDAKAFEAAGWESRQEAGIDPKNLKLFSIATSGGPTIKWDLYYFVCTEFEMVSQELEFGENITVEWTAIDKVIEIALSNKMKEDRSVGVLMKYLRSIGKI